jgi:hypothetical protein
MKGAAADATDAPQHQQISVNSNNMKFHEIPFGGNGVFLADRQNWKRMVREAGAVVFANLPKVTTFKTGI